MSYELGAGRAGEGRPGRGTWGQTEAHLQSGGREGWAAGWGGAERSLGEEAAPLCPEMTTPPRETRAWDATAGGGEAQAQDAETPPEGQLPLRCVLGAGAGAGQRCVWAPSFLTSGHCPLRVSAKGDLEQSWRPIQEAGECST